MQNMNPVLLGSNEPNPFIPNPPPGAKLYRDLFTYQVPVFASLAILVGTATNQILIQNDSDFEWVMGVYQYDLAAAAFLNNTAPVPNSTVLIVDSGSGRQLSNAAVPVS